MADKVYLTNKGKALFGIEPTKTTRYEKILANMTIEQMAELRVEYNESDSGVILEYIATDTGKEFKTSKEAITAEIEWLQGVDE